MVQMHMWRTANSGGTQRLWFDLHSTRKRLMATEKWVRSKVQAWDSNGLRRAGRVNLGARSLGVGAPNGQRFGLAASRIESARVDWCVTVMQAEKRLICESYFIEFEKNF